MANDTWYRRIDGKGNVREELFMSEKDASAKGLMPPGLAFRVVIDGSEEHMRAVKDSPAHKHEMLVAQATLNRAVIDDKDSIIQALQALQAERDRLSDRSKADDALIERLTTALRLATDELDRLREALRVIEGLSDYEASDGGAQSIARRALEGEKG